MKCKSWSNKLNNFFTRKLKSLKANGQQHSQQTQQQQQHIPPNKKAVEKEKVTTELLNDKYSSESDLKEEQRSLSSTSAEIPDQSKAITSFDTVSLKTQEVICCETMLSDNCICVDKKQSKKENWHNDCTCYGNFQSTSSLKNQLIQTVCDDDIESAEISSTSQDITEAVSLTNKIDSSRSLKPLIKKNVNDFVFGKLIGEGSYSTVYLGRDIHTKRSCAIKVCNKQHIVNKNKKDYVRREREALSILSGVPGFVNLHCTFQDARSLYFVMTYASHGDLLPYINKVGSFDLDCTRHYAAELVHACEQMHSRNIVHRDLKPENILIDGNMHILIGDFGSAKFLNSISSEESQVTTRLSTVALMEKYQDQKYDEGYCNDTDNENENNADSEEDFYYFRQRQRRRISFVGTAQYVSPEVLRNGTISPSIDLWALGCIIYQMISGLPPFRAGNEFLIFKEITNCNVEFPPGFDHNAENLIRSLLKLNPAERLGAQDRTGRYDSIRSHPFFEGINFDTIRETTPPPIIPSLSGVSDSEELFDHQLLENLEPGLNQNQLRRLLGMELGTSIPLFDNAT